MEDSFYGKVNGIIYEFIPEEDHIFTVFKQGNEHLQMVKNKNSKWMRIDYKTDLPIIEVNDEVEDLGRLIDKKLSQ